MDTALVLWLDVTTETEYVEYDPEASFGDEICPRPFELLTLVDQCEIEWFHVECVGLTGPVKGKWLCPICREKEKKK
jgi:hypothetical protein